MFKFKDKGSRNRGGDGNKMKGVQFDQEPIIPIVKPETGTVTMNSTNAKANVNFPLVPNPPLLSAAAIPMGDTLIRSTTTGAMTSTRLYRTGIPELTIEEQKDDVKTIWGSDIVKFAVNQTNDFLFLEDLLFDTNFVFICPNLENNAKQFENVLRNEKGQVIFYLQDQENWSSTGWSLFECTTLEFSFRLFNTNLREVMHVKGKQCCYNGGYMEVRCGSYLLGTINQQSASRFEGCQFAVKEPNNQVLASLKKVNSGQYDLLRNYTVKIGEIRQHWQHTPLPINTLTGGGNITYGISMDLDMPTHEKHLLVGASLLLFYQKYRKMNNSKRCIYAFIGKMVILLIVLGIVSGFVVYYK